MENINFDRFSNIVIKVGSTLIAPEGHSCSAQYCLPLANFIKKCQEKGKAVTLVSSGAVAAGFNTLKPNHKTLSLDEKQALAAVGQSKVISHWQRFFDRHVAQVLLTSDDIHNPKRAANAQSTLQKLQSLDILPIVNENDTVVTEELKFGDNDNLAAQVAVLIDADLLIICSDVDGLYNANPHLDPTAKLIPYLEKITPEVVALGQDSHNAQATGGMRSKLMAAKTTFDAGIPTVICNGLKEHYQQLLIQQNPGTLISPNDLSGAKTSPVIRKTYS